MLATGGIVTSLLFTNAGPALAQAPHGMVGESRLVENPKLILAEQGFSASQIQKITREKTRSSKELRKLKD